MNSSIVADANSLPLRPGTAMQVLDMLDDIDSSARDIAGLVNTEPIVTARVLGLANSPLFHRGNEIIDIDRAIVAIGMDSVRAIALGVAVDSLFEDHVDLDTAHWDHAILTAGAAVATALHRGVDGGKALCAGLMLDIGQIAMAITSPSSWTAISQETAGNSPDRLALEREVFSGDHAHVGSTILARLGLPETIAAVVESHHQPFNPTTTPLAQCVAIASVISELPRNETTDELDQLVADLDVTAEQLVTQTGEQVDNLRIVFSK